MRAYHKMLCLLWIAAILSGASCLGELKEIDTRLDQIDARRAELEQGGVTAEEQEEYDALGDERTALIKKREEVAEKAKSTGNALGGILGIAGLLLGIPVLTAAGAAVGAATESLTKPKK